MIEVTERRFPSSDGKHQLYCRVYLPAGEIKGLFHIVHGMIEHIGRYDRLMRFMAENGWVCYGFDNLGHGRTAKDGSELGYIGGHQYLLADVRRFTAAMKEEFGQALPCVLMGHSMGSFIVRCTFTSKLWDKLIIMGTGGPNPAAKPGILLINFIIRRKGERYVSPAIERLMFGTYNSHFDEEDAHAWLSSIKENRDLYHSDRYCAFHFCASSMSDLLRMLIFCNRPDWFRSPELNVPILLLSGSEDPVGNYGKGVRQVYDGLVKNGKNAVIKLYQDARHEVLNDFCAEDVHQDILAFVNA
ncbi:MAG: alpha/beta fold hydrolase [Ruminococcus sp.]|nr:alpha/beta fold hydrolase [Ruminococcus sp.]